MNTFTERAQRRTANLPTSVRLRPAPLSDLVTYGLPSWEPVCNIPPRLFSVHTDTRAVSVQPCCAAFRPRRERTACEFGTFPVCLTF
jgi:hypothetical protein